MKIIIKEKPENSPVARAVFFSFMLPRLF